VLVFSQRSLGRPAAVSPALCARQHTWLVFSDQVLHAAMAGQFMMEQTFTLDPDDQLDPAKAQLRVLERLCGHRLRA
jgi:hypothetical protein